MTSIVPAPSKEAIRVLAKLAFGTPRTLAITGDILKCQSPTSSIRGAYKKAHRITSSRNYIAGTTAIQDSHDKRVNKALNDTSPNILTTVSKTSLSEIDLKGRQSSLAFEITKHLAQTPENLMEAVAVFCDAFEKESLANELGLSDVLIESLIKLSKAARARMQFQISGYILDLVLLYAPIHEQHFHQLGPDKTIETLLSRTLGDTTGLIPEQNLKKAVSIYLAKFLEEPKNMSERMLSLGDKLCRETYRSGLYSLTCEVFNHRTRCRGNHQLRGVKEFIFANHQLAYHERTFDIFCKYYSKTFPDELQHWKVISCVVDSVLQSSKPHNAEAVLTVATNMARTLEITNSTTSLLKVLAYDWKSFKNIERTQNLFERLKPLCSTTNHPTACYGAMIQFCIEANDEASANSYYAELRKTYKVEAGDVNIYVHFARAKAMRQDWTGVEEHFLIMKRLAPMKRADRSTSFIPILRLFAESHSAKDTEYFIEKFVKQFDLCLIRSQINKMLESVYGSRLASKWLPQ